MLGARNNDTVGITACSVIDRSGIDDDGNDAWPLEWPKAKSNSMEETTVSFHLAGAHSLSHDGFHKSFNWALGSRTLVFHRAKGIESVNKEGLQVTVIPRTPKDRGPLWEISDGNRNTTDIYATDLFVDSGGHIYHGDEIGIIIAKWANVTPARLAE